MTDQTAKRACPACGSAAHIYARIDVKWNPGAGAWEVLQPDSSDRFECTDCDAEFAANSVGLPDPVAGLRYQPEVDEAREVLREAITRVELAASEGQAILSAWLPSARAILARIDGTGTPTAGAPGPTPYYATGLRESPDRVRL